MTGITELSGPWAHLGILSVFVIKCVVYLLILSSSLGEN